MTTPRQHQQKPQRRTQEQRRSATHTALLEACARQLSTAGYAATTTSTVAEAAGLSRGALQHTFEDRAALMAAVAQHGYQRLVDDLRAAAPSTGGTGERVVAVIDAMLAAYGAPTAVAAYEVLLGERSNLEFMALHAELLQAAEADLDELWLMIFEVSGAAQAAILQARRVARAAVLGLVARTAPLGADPATATALATAITALLTPPWARP